MEKEKIQTSSVRVRSVEDLGRTIRARRKENSLTQQNVADFSGVGKVFVVHLEKGKPSIQLGKVLEVLTGLGLELVVQPRGEK
ncbi:MAG: helix-turn-helix transcriptional regulator [Desulfoplanes sp.]|nr:helix-turn-helix transcriptional regulator [Desulfoplanes sp.]MDD4650281.1 helix-turn-helix transcriptional regulator [Desulfoplanes sp.]